MIELNKKQSILLQS